MAGIYGARSPYGARTKIATVPPPILGWNARDSLAAMPRGFAIQLDNWIPGTDGISLRGGYSSHVTGIGAAVHALMEYSGPTGTRKLFAAAPTAIYDVTSAGAVGAAAVSSLTNGKWQHAMFSNSGGNYLVLANGADDVREYDGTTWTSPSITGVTSANLIHVTSHMRRLWFVEKDSLSVWYLAANAISGAATELDIGPLVRKGGYIMACASWTRDGGSGADDVFVIITSNGQVVLYSGTDPSSANTWSMVGIFDLPKPVGRRCVIKAGADLLIVTARGLIPMSTVLDKPASADQKFAVTDNVVNAFQTSYATGGVTFGWQAIEYPKKSLVICNIPDPSSEPSKQFVLNMINGAWCRFTNLDALCWEPMGDDLYFGGAAGTVFKYDVDYLDNDEPIAATVFPAFDNYGSANKKRFIAIRPNYLAISGTEPPLTLRVDYDTSPASLIAGIPEDDGLGAEWDEEFWDDPYWGAAPQPIVDWQDVAGIGHVGSFISLASSETQITINSIDVQFEEGGLL